MEARILNTLPAFCHQDVAFIVYSTRRVAESDAGRGADSTITRLGFEKALKDARRNITAAVAARVRLFGEMCEATPKMGRLLKFANEFSHAAAAAERAFSILFAINPQVNDLYNVWRSGSITPHAAPHFLPP